MIMMMMMMFPGVIRAPSSIASLPPLRGAAPLFEKRCHRDPSACRFPLVYLSFLFDFHFQLFEEGLPETDLDCQELFVYNCKLDKLGKDYEYSQF